MVEIKCDARKSKSGLISTLLKQSLSKLKVLGIENTVLE